MRVFALRTKLEPPFGNHRLQTLEKRFLSTEKTMAIAAIVFFSCRIFRYRPKGVLGNFKGVGNNKNASEMRQECAKIGLVLLGREERSEMPQNCSRGANREKLTVKKIINKEMFFCSPFMSLTNREKSA